MVLEDYREIVDKEVKTYNPGDIVKDIVSLKVTVKLIFEQLQLIEKELEKENELEPDEELKEVKL